MKFLRVGESGNEIPAILDDKNNIRNLSNIFKAFLITSMWPYVIGSKVPGYTAIFIIIEYYLQF